MSEIELPDNDDDVAGYAFDVEGGGCVYCGQVSRALFESEDCGDLHDDFGWFIVFYEASGKSGRVMAKAADEWRGKEIAQLLANALSHPSDLPQDDSDEGRG